MRETKGHCRTTGKVCFSKKGAETKMNFRMQGGNRVLKINKWDKRKKKAKWNSNRPEFLRIYQCPDCDWWHLTHTKDGKQYTKTTIPRR